MDRNKSKLQEPKKTLNDHIIDIQTNSFHRETLETSTNGIAFLNKEGKIGYIDPVFGQYLGYTKETAPFEVKGFIGKKLFTEEVPFSDADIQKLSLLEKVLRREEDMVKSSQVAVNRGNNQQYFNIIMQRLYDGIRIDITDVTEEMVLATTDKLTGIFNRAYLEHVLFPKLEKKSQKYTSKMRESYGMGIIYIDLKKFKKINDNYGHKKGDKMLIDVANLLVENVNEKDSVIRLGGDEFAIICTNVDDTVLKEMKFRLEDVQKKYNEQIENPELHMRMDIGYEHGTKDYRNLLTIADQKMLKNKRKG